ncbi:MAG TPA: sugar phosphate isomerase/epimerase family protein [Phycisphaerae bacterium]|jgi:sugar phosphate isomerase/epimerase
MQPLEIGVCAWSIDRQDTVGVFATIREQLGLGVTQLGFFGRQAVEAAEPQRVRAAAAAARVEIVATFVGFDGQDYSSIAAIARTGGFVPDEFWDERFELTRRAAELTRELGVGQLGLHIGAIPTERPSPEYNSLARRTQQMADLLDDRGLTALVETGPDSVETLTAFLDSLERENLQVGFDPGNLVTYGSGDAVQAAAQLRGRIGLVHVKDATASSKPGVEWGQEAFPGTGDADIPRVISKLRAGGYRGPLLIERRTSGGVGDIPECRDYIRSLIGG